METIVRSVVNNSTVKIIITNANTIVVIPYDAKENSAPISFGSEKNNPTKLTNALVKAVIPREITLPKTI